MNNTETKQPDELSQVPLEEVYAGLNTRERNVMDVALLQYSGGTVRHGQDWLKCPGLGGGLYQKLKKKGMVILERRSGLSARAENVLYYAQVDCDKNLVRDALRNGKLKPGGYRGYGKKVDEELRAWCGLPSLPKWVPIYAPRKLWKFNPLTGEPITSPPPHPETTTAD